MLKFTLYFVDDAFLSNYKSSNFKTLQNEIEHLYDEKCQLEQFVLRFRNSNKKYLKIKSIAEEEAVIEALRMAPDRYAIIFNTKYDIDNGNSSTTMLSCKPYQNYFYDNEYQKGLLEVAKAVSNSLSNQLVNKTMVDIMQDGGCNWCAGTTSLNKNALNKAIHA
jgi:hypothetical protein